MDYQPTNAPNIIAKSINRINKYSKSVKMRLLKSNFALLFILNYNFSPLTINSIASQIHFYNTSHSNSQDNPPNYHQ